LVTLQQHTRVFNIIVAIAGAELVTQLNQ